MKVKPAKLKKLKTAPSYKRHRYPEEIIEEGVWLYFCFALSYREVEVMLARRGIEVSYQTNRQWCLKFGQAYANFRPKRHKMTASFYRTQRQAQFKIWEG